MKDRIRQLMESMHMNQQTFANHIHLSTATLSSILLGRTKPTLNTVEAIQKYCPNVNLGWLMNGNGDIYSNPEPTLPPNGQSDEIDSAGSSQDLFSSYDGSQHPNADSNNQDGFSSDQVAPQPAASYPVPSSHVSSPASGRAATSSQQRTARQQIQNINVNAKNIDKYTRHITEIRVYYDDQTWETFVPQK